MKHINSWLVKNQLAGNDNIKAYLSVKFYHYPNKIIPSKTEVMKRYQLWTNKANKNVLRLDPKLDFFWENRINSILSYKELYTKNKDSFDGSHLQSRLRDMVIDCLAKEHYDILELLVKMPEYSSIRLGFNKPGGGGYSTDFGVDSYDQSLVRILNESCQNGNLKAIKLVVPKLMRFKSYDFMYKPNALMIAQKFKQKRTFMFIEQSINNVLIPKKAS